MKFHVNQIVFNHQIKAPVKVLGFDNGKVVIKTKTGNPESVEPKILGPYKSKKSKIAKIKIKYFSDIEKIKEICVGNWIDLRSAETVEMKSGEYKLISLGVGMKLPYGHEAHLIPRSSTFKNYGIIQANSMGLIDNSYSGNEDIWRFPAYATKDTVINKNDRIAQFRIVPIQPKIQFIEVENLDETSRGGIGSTGIN